MNTTPVKVHSESVRNLPNTDSKVVFQKSTSVKIDEEDVLTERENGSLLVGTFGEVIEEEEDALDASEKVKVAGYALENTLIYANKEEKD